MDDELLLLRKIADYFQRSNKSSIADLINLEITKENPNYASMCEPDYVKEDLRTIFSKYVKVKRRQSQVSSRNNNKLSSRSIAYQGISKSNKFRDTLVIDETDENIDVVSVAYNDIDQFDSINVQPNHTHSISENPIRKSQFIPTIISTPCNANKNNKLVNENQSVMDTIKLETSHIDENNSSDDEDNDSCIIYDEDPNFHQTINIPIETESDICDDLNEALKSYEQTFIKPSQMSQLSSMQCLSQIDTRQRNNSRGSSNITDKNTMDNDDDFYNNSDLELDDGSKFNPLLNQYESAPIKFSNNIPQQTNTTNIIENTSQLFSSQYDIKIKQSQLLPEKTQEQTDMPFQCGQLNIDNQSICDINNDVMFRHPITDHQDTCNPLISQTSNQINSRCSSPSFIDDEPIAVKSTHEIATQCDPEELFEHVIIPRKRPREVNSDDDHINKIPKLNPTDINDIVDLDEICDDDLVMEEDLFLTQNDDRNVCNRSRHSSLSSIDDFNDEPSIGAVIKTKKEYKSKQHIVFKDDKKLDFERRILLSDGWIIWPKSILSNVLKSFDVPSLLEVVGESELLEKKDLVNQCLLQMCNDNLLYKCKYEMKKKKFDFFLKFPVLSDEILQKYEIVEDVYEDRLWNKSSGPKNNRKLGTIQAPKVAKALLDLELTFVNRLIEDAQQIDE